MIWLLIRFSQLKQRAVYGLAIVLKIKFTLTRRYKKVSGITYACYLNVDECNERVFDISWQHADELRCTNQLVDQNSQLHRLFGRK